MRPPVRHVAPVAPGAATGTTAAVYRQVKDELGVIGPAITMLSPAPEVLAAVWALLRESLLVGGPEERVAKEVVATAVAVKNECRFCTDAHTMMLHAAGEPELAEAVRAGRTPPEWAALAAWSAAPSVEGPFPAAAAPRFIGTALVFEVITRLVAALTVNASPHPVTTTLLGRAVASRMVRRSVAADLEAGLSRSLFESVPKWMDESALDLTVPAWAEGSPVGGAYARLRATAALGRDLVGGPGADAVEAAVATAVAEHGTALVSELPEMAGLEALHEPDGLGARLALQAALRPSSITDEAVAAWRSPAMTDHCVVFLLAYGAVLGVDRAQSTLAGGPARTESADA